MQVREELYGTANQPVCIGKRDEQGNWLFPVKGALDPNEIAICIGERILQRVGPMRRSRAASRGSRRRSASWPRPQDIAVRTPYFCSGCPHNSSTVVPEGMRAYAGIGCHYMAQWMDRSTSGYTQMGGEGANWIGEAPFSQARRTCSRISATAPTIIPATWRSAAAIAAGVNITYKILFNDAVAMTGGQANDGGLTVPQIARQVAAEGAKRIVVVTDEPWKYPQATPNGRAGLTIHHRDELERRAAGARGDSRRHSADLRPDLRRREAPPPQARHYSRSRQARDHQRARVRRLRRLRREVELRLGAAAGDRMGPQAHHRPVELQQGFLLRERVLPVVRDGARRAS